MSNQYQGTIKEMNIHPNLNLTVNGKNIEVPETGQTLLDVLRDHCGLTSVKDGCSPQGQCGCCTVLIDGQARVSCVTPARRVTGREITTLEGLDQETQDSWGTALCATGGSQCGFCTPGIIMRFADLKNREEINKEKAERALHAHLCRCTGWQTILEAWDGYRNACPLPDQENSQRRAEIEGGTPQATGLDIALGKGGFSADTVPPESLFAVLNSDKEWVIGENLLEARQKAGKIQGRRTTINPEPPIELPEGDWIATLQTHWVDPAYLELDASWCEPNGTPSSLLANGGAFGAKQTSFVQKAAQELANQYGKPVLAQFSREDSVRFGPKRPPVAGGIDANGKGILRIARTPGINESIQRFTSEIQVEEIDIPGPPTSSQIRAAGWAEAAALLSAAKGTPQTITSPSGGSAKAQVTSEGITVSVTCGDPLDEITLRAYCIGAAHMAWSWVTSESLTVDKTGEIHDLTIRSFGITPASMTPPITVIIEPDDGEPVNGSDAVFAAVASATWLAQGTPTQWPTKLDLVTNK